MKRLLAFTLTLLLFLQITTFADGETISVQLDGDYITFDQPPVMQNDRVLVPLRAIFEALNATVEWDDASQTVKSTKGNTVVIMQIGNSVFTVNSTEKTLDVPPQIIGSRTLVPVRAIAESFDCNVDWDNTNRIVIIDSNVDITISTKKISLSDGLFTYYAEYPEIQRENPYVAASTINKSIEDTINKRLDDTRNFYENAGILFSSYNVEYGITNKSNNLFAVLYTASSETKDGSVTTSRFAEVYKLDTGEKATLTDYFPHKTYEEIIAMIITDFNMIILQEPELFYENAAELVEIYIDDVVVYPCGNEIAVTFNPGVIAPYEFGFKTLTYPAVY